MRVIYFSMGWDLLGYDNKSHPILAKTMVLEYGHQHLPGSPKSPSVVGFHISAPWFASGQ